MASTTTSAGLEVIPSSPQATQCVPLNFHWKGGVPPYTFEVVFDADVFGKSKVVQTYSGIITDGFQWAGNFAAGSNVGFIVADSGKPPHNLSTEISDYVIQPGTDDSCLAYGTTGSYSLTLTSIPTAISTSQTSALTSSSTSASVKPQNAYLITLLISMG